MSQQTNVEGLQWSGSEVGRWFLENHVYGGKPWCVNQGCEGFKLARDGTDYRYIWVESFVDHDLEVFFLIDVRTNIGKTEMRDYLFVACGYDGVLPDCRWHQMSTEFSAPIGAHNNRFLDGMKWFAEKISDYHMSRHKLNEA